MSYNPSVGRWMQQDPEGYVDGNNLYQFEDSNPVNRLDPTGMASATTQPTPEQKAAQAELDMLKQLAEEYVKQDSICIPWFHDCVAQSQGLQDWIWSHTNGGKNLKYWLLRTEQRFTKEGGSHNVVIVEPLKVNPLPPMYLDTWHVCGPRIAILKPYPDFIKDYPLPSDPGWANDDSGLPENLTGGGADGGQAWSSDGKNTTPNQDKPAVPTPTPTTKPTPPAVWGGV